MPGGGTKSRGPSAGNRLWAPALSLIQIFRSHARASAHARKASGWPRDCWLRERCSQREASQVLPSEIGVGFRCEASSQATIHDGVSCADFFSVIQTGGSGEKLKESCRFLVSETAEFAPECGADCSLEAT